MPVSKMNKEKATDMKLAREDDNDPSDEMEVEINTSEKTNANNQEKGEKKMNKRKRGPTK
jgi:hypothetical protein